MTLLARSLRSGVWMTLAYGIALVILAVRSVALARLLPVETFGIYALAIAVVAFADVVARWGLDAAFLHRSRETADVQLAASVHFTLHLTLSGCILGSLAILAFGLADGALLTALLALVAAQFALHLTYTPQVLLYRRVSHERVAVLHVVRAAATTTICVSLAAHGATLWALLAIDIVAAAVACAFYYAWRPVWHPRVTLRGDIVRYFLRFGSQNLLGQLLHQAWRRADKVGTGALLGQIELGFYSRAYSYGIELNALAYRPLSQVVVSALAALKYDRSRLSTVVQNVSGMLFRATCCLAGLAVLTAPEVVTVLIGTKWLPMVTAFRLLALTFALNPITTTLSYLAVALGRPGVIAQMHLVRLIALLCAMPVLVPLAGISGMAAGVSISVLAGIAVLWRFASRQVEISFALMAVPPVAALAAGMAGGALSSLMLPSESSAWSVAATKSAAFLLVFVAFLWLVEGRRLIDLLRWLWETYRKSVPQADKLAE